MKNIKILVILILPFLVVSCNFFNSKEEAGGAQKDSVKIEMPEKPGDTKTALASQNDSLNILEARNCTDAEIADMIKDSILAGKLRTVGKVVEKVSTEEMKRIIAFRYADEVREVRQFIDPNFVTTKTYIKKPGGSVVAWHNQSEKANTANVPIVFSLDPIQTKRYPLRDHLGNKILIERNYYAQCLLSSCNNFDTYQISIIEKP